MSPSEPTPASLVDRRRLRRKLSFWRIFAGLVVIVAIGVAGWRFAGRQGPVFAAHYIARVPIQGLITGDQDTIKLIDDLASSSAVAGVVLSIESPGGTTSGAEREYLALRRLAAKKPVVATVGTMAASGAYIAALGADRIFAEGNSLVGSIGVLFEYPNFAKLLDTVGVQVESVKSSPLKAAPNGFEPTSPEARAALASLVSDSFDWFKGLVKDRRGMSDAELAQVSDGRVFTGRQGLPLKLIDAIGDEKDAIAWLESDRNVTKDLPVRERRPARRFGRLGIFGFAAAVAEIAGFDHLAQSMQSLSAAQQTALLDGLTAVWQGSAAH